jgi:phage antirepressor YoqD-like protein
MSSKEIAELTGKRHSDVLRDIDTILETLHADLAFGFKSTPYVDSTGKSNRMFELDRESTYCLVAGYDVKARMCIIKRWQELESNNLDSYQIEDPGERAIRWAAEYKEKQLAIAEAKRLAEENRLKDEEIKVKSVKIEEDAPKVEFHDKYVLATTITQIGMWAKEITKEFKVKIGPNTLFHWLRVKGFLMIGRDETEHNHPYAKYTGLLFVVEPVENPNVPVDNRHRWHNVTHITQLGKDTLTAKVVLDFKKGFNLKSV